MGKEQQTHYPLDGEMVEYDYYTIRPDRKLGFIVHGFGRYDRTSVLSGQPMKRFLDSFDTQEAALEVYPGARNGSLWTDPKVNLEQLPGEDDPVPGGMYPDDWV